MIQLKREWIETIGSERSWYGRGTEYRFGLNCGTLGKLSLRVLITDEFMLRVPTTVIAYQMQDLVMERATLEFNHVLDEMPLIGLS